MQLILAIDSDPRQSGQLASLVRKLRVDLVQATSAGEGLHALGDRVPDLILTSPLLSPFDDGVLDEYLRDLGAAATHVQTLRIPLLSATQKKSGARGLFSLGRKRQSSPAAPDGCDPRLFADEIELYLKRAAEDRQALSMRPTPAAQIAHVAAPVVEVPPEVEFYIEPEYYGTPVAEPEYVTEPVVTRKPAFERIEESQYIKPQEISRPAASQYIAEPVARRVAEPIAEPKDLFVAATEDPGAARIAPAQSITKPVARPPAVPAPPAATPPASADVKMTSPSFEAALAAIRAAWDKPAKDGSVTPAPAPVAPVAPIAPPVQQAPAPAKSVQKVSATQPEKPRGRKAHGAQDEWGVFDPSQCDLSTLADKLDEVTDTDDVTPRMIATARIITAG